MKCDELKARHAFDVYEVYAMTGDDDAAQVYLKPEVDKILEEKDVEIRRLKRALYKACANWADVEVFERTVSIDDPNVEAHRWALMRNKCLKKAEEYK